ncbi:MAG: tyrosine-type recombinase/integrase, partial [Alphaproteobacteria bacterium]|nr:tyrosine-type recombinase/integrase [Alphaproteobacteria bacterium]
MLEIDRFLEMLAAEKGMARSTLSAYESDLKDFSAFLTPNELHQATSQDIQNYFITQKHLAPSSLARRLSSLRQFYKYLMSEENLTENPTVLIEAPRYRRKLPSVLSEEDVNRLLEGASTWKGPEGVRLSALLELLYASGFRVSELVTLPATAAMEVLKSEKPFLMIRGKGNKDRLVPLTSAALKTLKAYLKIRMSFLKKGKESSWLFPSPSKEGHLTRQRFGQLLKELSLKVGLNPHSLSPHTL